MNQKQQENPMKSITTIAAFAFVLAGLGSHAQAANADATLKLQMPTIASQATPAFLVANLTPEDSQPAEINTRTTLFGLPQNMGPADRIVRGVIAAALVGVGTYGLASGNISTEASAAMLAGASVPTATAATGYCPLYHVIGIDYTF